MDYDKNKLLAAGAKNDVQIPGKSSVVLKWLRGGRLTRPQTRRSSIGQWIYWPLDENCA